MKGGVSLMQFNVQLMGSITNVHKEIEQSITERTLQNLYTQDERGEVKLTSGAAQLLNKMNS